MALNVYNMKQVLIPFRAFLPWGDIKKYFFEHHSYFWASFYQKKKQKPKNIIRCIYLYGTHLETTLDYPDRWVGGNLMLFVSGDSGDFLSATCQPLVVSCRNSVL